jgi:hypothetical protein
MNIDGALGVSLVDWESGMSLGAVGGGKYLDRQKANLALARHETG